MHGVFVWQTIQRQCMWMQCRSEAKILQKICIERKKKWNKIMREYRYHYFVNFRDFSNFQNIETSKANPNHQQKWISMGLRRKWNQSSSSKGFTTFQSHFAFFFSELKNCNAKINCLMWFFFKQKWFLLNFLSHRLPRTKKKRGEEKNKRTIIPIKISKMFCKVINNALSGLDTHIISTSCVFLNTGQ